MYNKIDNRTKTNRQRQTDRDRQTDRGGEGGRKIESERDFLTLCYVMFYSSYLTFILLLWNFLFVYLDIFIFSNIQHCHLSFVSLLNCCPCLFSMPVKLFRMYLNWFERGSEMESDEERERHTHIQSDTINSPQTHFPIFVNLFFLSGLTLHPSLSLSFFLSFFRFRAHLPAAFIPPPSPASSPHAQPMCLSLPMPHPHPYQTPPGPPGKPETPLGQPCRKDPGSCYGLTGMGSVL